MIIFKILKLLNSNKDRRKSDINLLKMVQYLLIGLVLSVASLTCTIYSVAIKYNASLDIILTRDSPAIYYVFILLSIICTYFFYKLNSFSIFIRRRLLIHINDFEIENQSNCSHKQTKSNEAKKKHTTLYNKIKASKTLKKLKIFSLKTLKSPGLLYMTIVISTALIYRIFTKATTQLPKNILDSFSEADLIIFIGLLFTISSVLVLGSIIWYSARNKENKYLQYEDETIFFIVFIIFAMVITYYYLYNFIKIAFDTDSFEDTIYSVLGSGTLVLSLGLLTISNRNPQQLTMQKLESHKSVSLAILLFFTVCFALQTGIRYSYIIFDKAITILIKQDNKNIGGHTLLIDRVNDFVAYDLVEKYSKVYQKSQYDWKPDRSVKTTESKPAKK